MLFSVYILCVRLVCVCVCAFGVCVCVETESSVVQNTIEDLQGCGYDCWETSLGGPGVQRHAAASVKQEALELLLQY